MVLISNQVQRADLGTSTAQKGHGLRAVYLLPETKSLKCPGRRRCLSSRNHYIKQEILTVSMNSKIE